MNTVTGFTSFVALTVIKSSEVNENFSNFRGDLIPIDPTLAAGADDSYDLGSTEYRWVNQHLSGGIEFANILDTATSFDPSVGNYFLYNRSGAVMLRDANTIERALSSAPMLAKTTLAYTDFNSQATTTISNDLLILQPGEVVFGYALNQTNTFTAASISSLNISNGPTDDTVTRYINSLSLGIGNGAALSSYHASDFDIRSFSSTITVQYQMVGDTSLSQLTAGQVDVWFYIGRLT